MPVLLLAQGDLPAKNLLKSAIKARYGMKPPILDSVRLDFRGRASVKVGRARRFVPVDATALFRFPNAMRLDFVLRPPGRMAQRIIESTDGAHFYYTPDGKSPRMVTDSQHQHSMVRRMWMLANLMLVPMSDMHVRLTETGPRSFKATHIRYNDSVQVNLDGIHRMDHMQVHCLNPRLMRQQAYTIALTKQQLDVDGLRLPSKMRVYWGKTPAMELAPYTVEQDITIPDSIFRVAYEGNIISTVGA